MMLNSGEHLTHQTHSGATVSDNRALWHATTDDPIPCPPLGQSLDIDVAIVGGGYTGLWTALWLSIMDPSIDIAVFEAKLCGHGASGRNGGWVMGSLEGIDQFADTRTGRLPEDVIEILRQLLPSFQETLKQQGIHCDFQHGGALYSAARVTQQYARARAALNHYHTLGFDDSDYRWLSATEAQTRVAASATQGAIVTPHVAVVHPRKLVLGLRAAVLARGIRLYENSVITTDNNSVLRALPQTVVGTDKHPPNDNHRANAAAPTVRATSVVWATEGYTARGMPLSGRLLPVHSGMVATEPLSDDLWQTLGFRQRQGFCDFSRLSTYVQRTADNRLVVGARGRMLYRANPGHTLQADPRDTRARITLARQLFPSLGDIAFPYAWGGTLGVARQQTPHVVFDQDKQWLTAGGYTGEGVGASFLMGRTLAELLVGQQSARTAMPWVHKGSFRQLLPQWEPQPLPYLAFQGMTQCYKLEEHYDAQHAQHLPAKLSRWGAATITKLLGR